MPRLLKLVLQGLGAVLPLGLTLYLLYWLLSYIEQFVKPLVLWFLGDHSYFPGLGILFAIPLLCCVGLLVNAYGFRYLVKAGDRLMARIPLIKSVYGALQDAMRVFAIAERKDLRTVVSLDIGNDTHVIGFVIGKETGKRLFPGEAGSAKVGVYIPMSFQIGGFTLYVEPERLRPLDINVEEAMRIAVTGGTHGPGARP